MKAGIATAAQSWIVAQPHILKPYERRGEPGLLQRIAVECFHDHDSARLQRLLDALGYAAVSLSLSYTHSLLDGQDTGGATVSLDVWQGVLSAWLSMAVVGGFAGWLTESAGS